MITLYLVLNVTPWKTITAEVGGLSFPVDIPRSGEYFAPVYNSKEDALRDYPNSEIREVSFE